MRLLSWLRSLSAPQAHEPSIRLVIDNTGVTCERAGGIVESVAWDDLQKVTIMTTDDGPLAEDVFFVLYGSDGGCVVPQGAPQSDALLERLQDLSGFDNEAVVRAMGCARNNEFLCWERTGRPT